MTTAQKRQGRGRRTQDLDIIAARRHLAAQYPAEPLDALGIAVGKLYRRQPAIGWQAGTLSFSRLELVKAVSVFARQGLDQETNLEQQLICEPVEDLVSHNCGELVVHHKLAVHHDAERERHR